MTHVRRLAAIAIGLMLVAPAAQAQGELSAADATKLIEFFDKLMVGVVANKDDCAKMAAVIDAHVTANAAMLRGVMKQLTSGKKLPADAEQKLNKRMEQDGAALTKCAGNSAVLNAMKRLENPDLPPSPPPEVLAELKPPVAADLETYTKAIAGKGDLIATITTSAGTVRCKLLADKAPMTVANFVGLATGKKTWLDPKTNKLQKNKPFFDGTIFHRVIPGFMIQGGDPTGTGMGGPGWDFADETSAKDTMAPGTLAMANSGPNTNGSQFFITEGAPDHLNGRHTIFGTCKPVTAVTKIAAVKRDAEDRPVTPLKMKVTISRGAL
jgi:peptidyl-prolyl cis-trans isomerase A (cyclophilin A)